MGKYDDIIDLPHHVSKVHPQMSIWDRSAQFAPFAALTGHEEAIAETARLTNEWHEPDEDNAGITFEMLQILSCLWHEQGITQQVLAERTAKDKACLTNLMNNLEKKGYVHRKEDPEDRRNKLVFLTPEGEEFKKQIRPILDQVYVHAEHIIGIENVETMLSELKAVHNVLENI